MLKELLDFLLKPKPSQVSLNIEKKLKNILKVYVYYFIFLLIVMGTCFYVLDIQEQNLVAEKIKKWSVLKTLVYGVVMVPLLEELMFRLPMIYQKKNFVIAVFIGTFFFFSAILFNQGLLDFSKNTFERLLLSAFVTSLFYCFIRVNNEKTRLFWKNNFSIIFYFLTLLFALLHVFNIVEIKNAYLIPILILPQLSSGLLIGFFRVKYGFIYGVIFHCLNNFVSMILF
ncbi:hypothetical protein [uncultured Tenacibaculum sp.]|uniref:hypothetical protein n=1 Tax=uncultured Tenacibaculum sp. TaxID=174713 RepID=UPI00262086F8|nr:hypothetical protein [uncultured Tenacibaculum sp.]